MPAVSLVSSTGAAGPRSRDVTEVIKGQVWADFSSHPSLTNTPFSIATCQID